MGCKAFESLLEDLGERWAENYSLVKQHPQIDGQTKVMNHSLGNLLKCLWAKASNSGTWFLHRLGSTNPLVSL